MNPDLADTLVQNLLKNSVKHNTPNGKIEIELTPDKLKISNTSNYESKDTEEFFQRFKKSNLYSKSPGIGLSIVKRICDLFEFKIKYESVNKIHNLTVCFNNSENLKT